MTPPTPPAPQKPRRKDNRGPNRYQRPAEQERRARFKRLRHIAGLQKNDPIRDRRANPLPPAWGHRATRAGFGATRRTLYWRWFHGTVLGGANCRLLKDDPLRAHGFTLDPYNVIRAIGHHGGLLDSERKEHRKALKYIMALRDKQPLIPDLSDEAL